MNSESQWQQVLQESPDDRTLLLAYGDWLEERGEQLKSFLARQRAGPGVVVLRLWHPSWGDDLFGEFATPAHLQEHIRSKRRQYKQYQRVYQGPRVPFGELVVVFEWRATPVEIERRPLADEVQF
jgi:uncharacterized protein (TIGR02996 family)